MFAFAAPWMAVLLVLPFIVRWFAPAVRRGALLRALRFPRLERLESAFAALKRRDVAPGPLFAILATLAWLGLTGALMQPQIVDQMTEIENRGYDIMLAVDLSGSMRALDFSTPQKMVNRLDVAKKAVGDFVRDRSSDRVGLVLFGDFAYQYAPLSPDTASVGKMLDGTVTSMAGDGTAIGDAIGMAVRGLRDRPAESRIIILLTDGEDTASTIPPMEAAQLAKNYGIRIYTIGIGSKGRVPYPGKFGQIVMVEMNLDETLLRNIADLTGGSYFHAKDANALQEIYKRIDKMEKTTVEKRQYMIRTPLYRYPLGLALAALALILTLPLAGGRRKSHG